jgi:hypothetical protein
MGQRYIGTKKASPMQNIPSRTYGGNEGLIFEETIDGSYICINRQMKPLSKEAILHDLFLGYLQPIIEDKNN